MFRRILICLPLTLLLLTAAEAQQRDKVARVGFLGFNNHIASRDFIDAFRHGLGELGYVEGKTIHIEYRWADTKPDRLPRLAEELVGLKVDVIFAAAAPSIEAAKNATQSIPIVFEMLADPVSAGFVTSLARPGANLTGIAGLAPAKFELVINLKAAKQIGLAIPPNVLARADRVIR